MSAAPIVGGFLGKEVRPDGLLRVTRGEKVWTALIEVKTGTRKLELEQVQNCLQVAKSRGFDAVVTISADLQPTPESRVLSPDARLTKSVALKHLAWEEIITEAAMTLHHSGIKDRTRERLVREFLAYGVAPASGMLTFDDMGKHWVPVRNSVKNRTVSTRDAAVVDVCGRFDRLIRHIALQLSVLLGQRVGSVVPAEHHDAVSRARQLADSGKLFGTIRIPGAAAPIVIEADLLTERIACAATVPAPRKARPSTDVHWLLRHLENAEPKTRLTAHHAGSRTETTSALLEVTRSDVSALTPPEGREVREFTVTVETRMGSKRAGSSGGFVATVTKAVNGFYANVVEGLRSPAER